MPNPNVLLGNFRRRKIPAIFFLFAAFCLAVTGLAWHAAFARIDLEYQLEVESIYRESDNLARSFEDHARLNLSGVDDTLTLARRSFEVNQRITPEAAKYLQEKNSRFIRGVYLLDETGTPYPGSPKPDRPNFAVTFELYNAHVNSDSDLLFIGKPTYDWDLRQWSLSVSHRLSHADGSFAGVAFALLNPDFFSDHYRQMVFGQDKQVALIGQDGVARAWQHKDQNEPGHDLSSSRLFPGPGQPLAGKFDATDPTDHVHRYYTYRTMLYYPLILSIGVSAADMLGDFEIRRKSYTNDAILFTIFAGAFFALVTLQLLRQKNAAEELRRRNKLLSFLHDTSLDIMNRRDVVDLLETILNKAAEITGASSGSVLLFNEERTERIRVVATGSAKALLGSRNPIGEGAAGQVWKTGKTVLLNNYKSWEKRSSPADTLAEAVVYFPLKSGGEVIGVIGLWHTEPGCRFERSDVELLDQMASLASIAYENAYLYRDAQREISERKQTEELLQYQNYHDALTGIYNRAFFEEEMQRIDKRRSGSVGLIVLDLDGLKLINDTLGHDQGDILLTSAAHILSSCFRSDDVVARIGGDEFAVLLHPVEELSLQDARQRILLMIQEFNSTQLKAPISLSLGYASAEDTSVSMRELFQRADNNMYREKLHRRQSTRSAIVQTVMKLLEVRDYITEGHADRLQTIITRMGSDLFFSAEKLADLRLFAQFHDMGKVGIPDLILLKPGPLTPEEKAEMQRHSEIGHRIAQSAPDLVPIADWVLKHHEWWNGKGYPLGLSGSEIPLECRILAIADAYDAMTSDRPYRKALSHAEALRELLKCSGTQFDPEQVKKFISLYGDSGPDKNNADDGKE